MVESPDELIFTNSGHFIPGSVENVIHGDATQERFRNRFLAEAMVNLNMIDTIGLSIRKMFEEQRKRYSQCQIITCRTSITTNSESPEALSYKPLANFDKLQPEPIISLPS